MEEIQATIPLILEDMLFKYIKEALRDDPDDYVKHAAEYFTRLWAEKQEKDGSMEYITEMLGGKATERRATVVGEQYNPEDDDGDDDIEITPKSDEERKRILSKSDKVFLLRVLDKASLNAVIDAMIRKPVKEDEVIIQQGDDGDFFYLIDSGKFNAYITGKEIADKLVATYENEGFFGELALLHNQPRAATVKAASEGLLWAVNRRTFNKLIIKRAFEKRKLYMGLLEGVSQLKPLSEYEKMQVADALSGRSYPSGEVIVHEGNKGDGMYFIVEGKVSVRQKKPADDGIEDIEIQQLEKGAFFGEMALVKHQPRAATVVAIEDTKVAFLDVKAFERLLGPCMNIMERHIESYE